MLKKLISIALIIAPIISISSDIYDLDTGELFIPRVSIGSDFYEAKLKDNNKNLIFTLESSKQLDPPLSDDVLSDTYDPVNKELTIPSVLAGDACYKATLTHDDNLVFSVSIATSIGVTFNTKKITIEPDDFSSNVDISETTSTATLSATGTDNLASNIFAFESTGQSTTGTQIFGYNNNTDGQSSGQWYFPERVLRIDFSSPTNFVSVDLKGFDSFDSGKMEIYNSTGTLLDTISVDLPENMVKILSSTRNSPDISYAKVYGNSKQDSAGIDNLQYNEIISVSCNVEG